LCSSHDPVVSTLVIVSATLTCARAGLVRGVTTIILGITVAVHRHAAAVIAGELGEATCGRGGRDQHGGQRSNQQSPHSHHQTWNKRTQYRLHSDWLVPAWRLFEDAVAARVRASAAGEISD
jgi:hypothetical protein